MKHIPAATATPAELLSALPAGTAALVVHLLKTLGATVRDGHTCAQLSDSRIDADDGALEKENPMCRIDGPFKDRNRWRVRVVDRDTGKATSRVFETEIDAKAAIPKLRREYSRPVGVPLSQALGEYELHLRAKGNRLRSIRVTIQRLTGFFRGIDNTDDLTPASADRLWATFTTTVTRLDKVPAFDTQANTLNQAGTFVAWAKDRGWMKVADPLGKLAPNGKRKRGSLNSWVSTRAGASWPWHSIGGRAETRGR